MNVRVDETTDLTLYRNKYRKLLQSIIHTITKEDRKLIRKAFYFTIEAHKGKRRKSGEPYAFHPIEVAIICAKEIGLGATSIIAALLHDVVEDTDYTLDDIKMMFGEKIARIVDGLTKISEIFKTQSIDYSIQAENFKKLLLTLSEDVRVILIKLADRLHNMRTLESLPYEKQIRVSAETSYLYAPLAHRLGLYAIKSEMEDLVLKYTEPEIYNSIVQKITETEAERKAFIQQFIAPIREELKKHNLKFSIIYRLKSISSIWNKMKKKQIPFEEVYDLFAVRIILDVEYEREIIACMLALAVVESLYKPNPERFRNWLHTPKANGYQAVHTTVMSKAGKWVEVQIRSKRMDDIAEKGYAAHWRYKEGQSNTTESNLDEWLNRIREILKDPDSNALDFLDQVKMSLFADEIFIFTPKGEMKTLPKNSTVLDFAYAVHSSLGNTCIGAKVNHKLVPINHVLKSGDQVEVITSEKQKPKENWLEFVVTARAISNIKKSLKEQKKEKINQGRERLQKVFEELQIEWNEKNINKLCQYLQYPSVQDMFLDFYEGKILTQNVKHALIDKKHWTHIFTRPFTKFIQQQSRKKTSEQASAVQTQKTSSPSYVLANCCNPIRGDDIIGFLQFDNIVIHRTSCNKIIQLSSTYGHKVVSVNWKNIQSVSYVAAIHLEGIDKIGLVKDISKIISEEHHLNIRKFYVEARDDIFEGKIELYVHDADELKSLIQKLKNVEGITKVYRYE